MIQNNLNLLNSHIRPLKLDVKPKKIITILKNIKRIKENI